MTSPIPNLTLLRCLAPSFTSTSTSHLALLSLRTIPIPIRNPTRTHRHPNLHRTYAVQSPAVRRLKLHQEYSAAQQRAASPPSSPSTSPSDPHSPPHPALPSPSLLASAKSANALLPPIDISLAFLTALLSLPSLASSSSLTSPYAATSSLPQIHALTAQYALTPSDILSLAHICNRSPLPPPRHLGSFLLLAASLLDHPPATYQIVEQALKKGSLGQELAKVALQKLFVLAKGGGDGGADADPRALYLWGRVLQTRGKREAAVENYVAALESMSSSSPSLMASAAAAAAASRYGERNGGAKGEGKGEGDSESLEADIYLAIATALRPNAPQGTTAADAATSAYAYAQAARLGNAEAALRLAATCDPASEEAFGYYEGAAAKGSGEAAWGMGVWYFLRRAQRRGQEAEAGRGAEKGTGADGEEDGTMAVSWFELGHAGGDARCALALGMILRAEKGEPEKEKAKQYLLLASESEEKAVAERARELLRESEGGETWDVEGMMREMAAQGTRVSKPR